MCTSYSLPDEEYLDTLSAEELEEELIRLTRWRDELLQQGNNKQADNLLDRIHYVEECLEDMTTANNSRQLDRPWPTFYR